MGITFTTNAPETITRREEVCSCAQFAPCWSMELVLTPDARVELRVHAYAECPMCHGSGVALVPVSDRPELDLNQGNASALFAALGLAWSSQGEMSIPEMRRAILRARNVDLGRYTRERQVEYGAPRAEGGVVRLRPLRMLEIGLNEEQLRERVERLFLLVEEGVRAGATVVRWS